MSRIKDRTKRSKDWAYGVLDEDRQWSRVPLSDRLLDLLGASPPGQTPTGLIRRARRGRDYYHLVDLVAALIIAEEIIVTGGRLYLKHPRHNIT
jgi:hypothetical protein